MCWICNGVDRKELYNIVDMLETRIDYWGVKLIEIESALKSNKEFNKNDINEDIKFIRKQIDNIYTRLDMLSMSGR